MFLACCLATNSDTQSQGVVDVMDMLYWIIITIFMNVCRSRAEDIESEVLLKGLRPILMSRKYIWCFFGRNPICILFLEDCTAGL